MLFLRRRQKMIHIGQIKFVLPILLIVLFIGFSSLTGSSANIKTVYAMVNPDNSCDAIVKEALPLGPNGPDGGLTGLPEYWAAQFIYSITGFDAQNPMSIIGTELNLLHHQAALASFLAAAPVVEPPEVGEEDYYLPGQEEGLREWLIPEEPSYPSNLSGDPAVLIYTTHNAESYKPTDGASKFEGKNAGVARVSRYFSQQLENKYGVKTYYCDVIHDYPDFAKAYNNSLNTVQQLLKKYPSIQLVLDIHRDAGLSSRSDTLVKIGDKEYAKVMIVIGNEHKNWRQNLTFAQKVEAKANELYPGLIKTIRIREERRYNQHLHPRSILLEFGSDLNKEEDALNSAAALAGIMNGILREGQ
ncbi:MAG: stage II sporulation protein P [Clostridia bacterium]|jgi:stage II sporulation protein P|nr:stage II sporulation protein P [Clostridia bacterium]